MSLDPGARLALRRAALLHDIGKIGIEGRALHKPTQLNDEETGSMQEHPRIGYEMLKGLRFLQPSLAGVLHHHERWDGTGYPDGIAGSGIPLLVRILTVADVFDALTSERPYRRALSPEAAIRAIIAESGGVRYDPDVVTAFVACRQPIAGHRPRGGEQGVVRRAARWAVPLAAALCLGPAFWVAALRGSTVPTTLALPVNVHVLTAPGYSGHASGPLAPLSARIIADARHDAASAAASPAPSASSGTTVAPTPSASTSPTGSGLPGPSSTANPLPTAISVPPTPTPLPLPTPTSLELPTPRVPSLPPMPKL